jgi:excisionase family DNA binding protein
MYKALLTLDEAAGVLSLSPRTLSRLLRDGEIPTVRIGRLVRVRTSDLHSWVERQAAGWTDVPPHNRPARNDLSGPAVLPPQLP